jgi:chaperone required for assembly of F1-ATPase
MKLPEQITTTDIRAADGTYTVLVNDEPLCTPKGHAVQLLSWELANAMADEIMAAGALDLQRLTLYALYATQRDFIEGRIEATIGAILQHLPGDFALHPDPNPVLAARQLTAWAPLLAYLRAIGPELPIGRPLQDMPIPWELTEALRTQLMAMSPAQLSVVLQAVTNLGSVIVGILLAQQGLAVDQAVSALTATASYLARQTHEGPKASEMFAAESQQRVQRLLQYAQLSA